VNPLAHMQGAVFPLRPGAIVVAGHGLYRPPGDSLEKR